MERSGMLRRSISMLLIVAMTFTGIPVFAAETKYEAKSEWADLYPMGVFNFEHTEYAALESAGTADINILRMGGTKGQAAVEFNATAVNTVYGEDFYIEGAEEAVESPGTWKIRLSFADGEASRNIRIHFLEDEASENQEVFLLSLANAENGASLGENISIPFSIEDDEEAELPVVQLASSTCSVNAAAGAVEIRVLREKGEQRLVSFDVATRSGTASVGKDYQGVTTSLMFNPGETEKKISVAILNEEAAGKEFTLELSNVQGGVLGEIDSCTIQITGEEEKPKLLFDIPYDGLLSAAAANRMLLSEANSVDDKTLVIQDSASADLRLGFKSLKSSSACEQFLGTAANGRLGFYYNARNSQGEAVISSTRTVDMTGIEKVRYTWKNVWGGDSQEFAVCKAYFTKTSDLNATQYNFGYRTGPFEAISTVDSSLITDGTSPIWGDAYINFSVNKTKKHLFFSDPIIDLYITKIELIKREYEMLVNPSPNGEIRLVKQHGAFSTGHDKGVRDDVFYIDATPDPGWRFKGYLIDKKGVAAYTTEFFEGDMLTLDSKLLRGAIYVDDLAYNKIHITPVFEKLPENTQITIRTNYNDADNYVSIVPQGGGALLSRLLRTNVRQEHNHPNRGIHNFKFIDNAKYRLLYWVMPDGRQLYQTSFSYDLTNVAELPLKAVVAPVSDDADVIDNTKFEFWQGISAGRENIDVLGLVPKTEPGAGKTFRWASDSGGELFYSPVYHYIADYNIPENLTATVVEEGEQVLQSFRLNPVGPYDLPPFSDPLTVTLYYNGKTSNFVFGEEMKIPLTAGRKNRVAMKIPGYGTRDMVLVPRANTVYFNISRIDGPPAEISWISVNNTVLSGREYTPIPRYDKIVNLTAKVNWNGRKPSKVNFLVKDKWGYMRTFRTVAVPPELGSSMSEIWNDVSCNFDLTNDLQMGDQIYIKPETRDQVEAVAWDTGLRIVSPQQFATADTASFDPNMAFGFRAPFSLPLLGEPNFSLSLFMVEMKGVIDRGAGTYTLTAGIASEIEKYKNSINQNNTKIPTREWFTNPLHAAGTKMNDYIDNMKDARNRALDPKVAPGLNMEVRFCYGMRVVFEFNGKTNEWQLKEGWVYIGGKMKVTKVYYFMVSFVPAFISLGATVDVKIFTGARYTPGLPPEETFTWKGIDVESKVLGNITGGAGIYSLAALTATGNVDAAFNGEIPFSLPARFTKAEVELAFSVGVQYLGFSFNYNLAKKKWDILEEQKKNKAMANDLLANDVFTEVESGFAPTPRDTLPETDWRELAEAENVEENATESKVYSFSEADPQLLSFGEGKKLLVFLEDDTSRESMDRSRLMFSILSDGQWSEPEPVDDDGTADYMPSVSVCNEKAQILWLNNTEIYGEEEPDINEYLNNYKATAVVIDLNGGLVEPGSVTALSSHSRHDSAPVVACDDAGNAVAVWTTTNFEEEISDLNSLLSAPSTVMYSSFDSASGEWAVATALEPLSGEIMSNGLNYSNGYFAFAYTVSADSSYETEEDEELFIQIFDPGKGEWTDPARISYNSQKDYNPSIVKTKAGELLFWQSGKKLCYYEMDLLTEYLLHPEMFTFVDPEAGFSEEARIVAVLDEESHPMDLKAAANENGNIVLLWKNPGEEVAQALFAAFGSVREDGEVLWSTPRQISETNMLIRELSLDCDNSGKFYTSFTKNDVIFDMDTEEYSLDDTALVFASVDMTKDIKVENETVSVSNTKPRPGEIVDISAYILNDGELPIEPGELEVLVYSVMDGQRETELTDENSEIIAAGYGQGASISFEMPAADAGMEGVGFEFTISGKTLDKYIAFEKAPQLAIENLTRSALPDGTCSVEAKVINNGNEDAGAVEIELLQLVPAEKAADGYGYYETPEGLELLEFESIAPSGMAGSEGELGAAKDISFLYTPKEEYYDETGLIELCLQVSVDDAFHTEKVFYISKAEFGPEEVEVPGGSGSGGGGSTSPGEAAQISIEDGFVAKEITLDPLGADAAGQDEVLRVENTDNADRVGILSDLRTLNNLRNKNVTLELKTPYAMYSLPLARIDMDAVLREAGEGLDPKDVKIRIEVSRKSPEELKQIQEAAAKGGLALVGEPLEFSISCEVGGKTSKIGKFNGFVQRLFPAEGPGGGENAATGVLVDDDGNLWHAPTKIMWKDGKKYLSISSMTNSTYALVSHQVAFQDMKGHWAEVDVNDAGSRLILSGVGNSTFEPDRGITRAEFAAVMVRALGLRPGTGITSFQDVGKTAWYGGYIGTASEYGIVSGYGNGSFGPKDNITREQAMAMIERAMKLTGLKVELQPSDADTLLTGFEDSSQVAEFAKESAAACVKLEIISGKGGDFLAPKDNISRAEVAAVVRRLLSKSDLI